jgi:hypothetical protein
MENKKEYFVLKSKDKDVYLSIDSEIGVFESDSANLFCDNSYSQKDLIQLIEDYETEFEFGSNPNNIEKNEFEIKKVKLVYL